MKTRKTITVRYGDIKGRVIGAAMTHLFASAKPLQVVK